MSYSFIREHFLTIDLQEMRSDGFLEKINNRLREKQKKVDLKSGWKEIDRCPVCESEEKIPQFIKFGVEIFCCAICTLRYSSKIPICTNDIYSDEAYQPFAIESYMENVNYRKARFGKERLDIIRRFVSSENEKSLLDVGCGTGWFLETAIENGFKVCGQELGKGLSEWTSKRLNIKVWNCSIQEINDALRFDVITMFDLLEHVENPVQLLLDCKRILADDGIILVFTPNFDSMAINVMGEHSNLIAPAEHLIYFTHNSVIELAQRTDLKLCYYKTCGIDLGDMKSYYEWRNEPETAATCAKLYDIIQPVIDEAEAGNHMRFILKMVGEE